MSITIEFKQKNSASFYRFTFEAQEMIENNIVGNHGNVVHFLTCRTYPSILSWLMAMVSDRDREYNRNQYETIGPYHELTNYLDVDRQCPIDTLLHNIQLNINQSNFSKKTELIN